MDEKKILEGSLQLIKKDLKLDDGFEVDDNSTFEKLHNFLTKRVQYLLDHDFSHLLNSLYRIDIPQNRVEEVLNYSEPEKIASELAMVIIEREKLKMITRLKYC